MSQWKLTCPRGGEYVGNCTYTKHQKHFNLSCIEGLRTIRAPRGGSCVSDTNPGRRLFLPYALTKREKGSTTFRGKLSRCIKQAEIKCCGKHTTDYTSCTCNPAAVCRATLRRRT